MGYLQVKMLLAMNSTLLIFLEIVPEISSKVKLSFLDDKGKTFQYDEWMSFL